MIVLEDLSEPNVGRVTRTPNVEITIGRESSCDIVYDKDSAPTVSRNHAKIHFDGKWYRLDDLGSRHGTWVNGARLRGLHYLQQGDVIQFGGGTGPQLRVGFQIDSRALAKGRGGAAKKSKGGALPWLWIGLGAAMLVMMVIVVVVLIAVSG